MIVIGDIHGSQNWKWICDHHLPKVDKILFIGDYFDDWNLPHEEMYKNFKNIISYKKKYSDQIILLFGNHDLQIIDYKKYGACRGTPFVEMNLKYGKELKEYLDKDIIYRFYMDTESSTLYSHAGVCNEYTNLAGGDEFIRNINLSYWWIRPKDLIDRPYKKEIFKNQVFGHTEKQEFCISKNNVNFYNVDRLNKGEYMYNFKLKTIPKEFQKTREELFKDYIIKSL